jgi:hypothetical protein
MQAEMTFTNDTDPALTRQCKRILAALRKHGSMTGVEIWQMCHVWNGKGRIFDLRQAGFCITTEWVKGENVIGEPFRCARYVLQEAK